MPAGHGVRKRRAGAVGVLVALLALAGCMTFDTRRDVAYDGPRTFSGTRKGLAITSRALLDLSFGVVLVFGADLPLSFLADVALLPLTLGEERERREALDARLQMERDAPSILTRTEGASPLVNARRLFDRCESFLERLDRELLACYAVDARIVLLDPAAPQSKRELSGREYKPMIDAALERVREEGGFISHRDPAYTLEGERVRVRATRISSFSHERAPVSLLLGPGTDGGWRILEEIGSGWP